MSADQELLKMVGTLALRCIKNRIKEDRVKPKSKKTRGKTLIKSSRLLRSIKKDIRGNKIIIGTNTKYARIHHEGGTIKPKKAKYLAIPIQPAAKNKSPREFEDTFIKATKNKKTNKIQAIIYQKHSKKPIALYVLAKQVKIPARPYMFLDNNDLSIITNKISSYYKAKLGV